MQPRQLTFTYSSVAMVYIALYPRQINWMAALIPTKRLVYPKWVYEKGYDGACEGSPFCIKKMMLIIIGLQQHGTTYTSIFRQERAAMEYVNRTVPPRRWIRYRRAAQSHGGRGVECFIYEREEGQTTIGIKCVPRS